MPSHVSHSNASTAVALRPTVIGGSSCTASAVTSRSSRGGSSGRANVKRARSMRHHPRRTYVRVKEDRQKTSGSHSGTAIDQRQQPTSPPSIQSQQTGHALARVRRGRSALVDGWPCRVFAEVPCGGGPAEGVEPVLDG